MMTLLAFLFLFATLAERLENVNSVNLPHTCCLNEKEIVIYDPQQASSRSKLEKCRLVSFVEDKNCGSEEVCYPACKAAFEGDKRYFKLKEIDAKEVLDKTKEEVKKGNDKAGDECTNLKAKAAKEFTNTVKKAKDSLASVQKAFDKAKEAFDKAKEAFDKAKTTLQREEASWDQTEREATATRDKSQKEAIQAFDKGKADREAQLKKKEEDLNTVITEGKDKTTKATPAECEKSKSCCCSVKHIPVRVLTTSFLDWDECKSPKEYDRAWYEFPCEYYSNCDHCRRLICSQGGAGVCP